MNSFTLGVLIFSTLVLLSWMLAGASWITYILPASVTMKPMTAVTFMLVSINTALNKYKKIYMAISGLALGLLLLSILTPLFAFLSELDNGIKSVDKGVPSIGTFVAFLAFTLGSILHKRFLVYLCFSIALIAQVGYATATPSLYYFFGNRSTAMAFHTSLLFIALSVGYLKPDKPKVIKKET